MEQKQRSWWLILLLVDVSACCLKAGHLFATDAACANADSARHGVRTLEDWLRLDQLLFAGLVVKLQPFVLFGFSLFLELLHACLLLELLLLQVLFVIRSHSFVVVLREHFDAHFVLLQLLDVWLTFVLICVEDHADISVVGDGLNCGFVKSSKWDENEFAVVESWFWNLLSIGGVTSHTFVADFPYFQRLALGFLIFVVSRSFSTGGTRWLDVFSLFDFRGFYQLLLKRYQLI